MLGVSSPTSAAILVMYNAVLMLNLHSIGQAHGEDYSLYPKITHYTRIQHSPSIKDAGWSACLSLANA